MVTLEEAVVLLKQQVCNITESVECSLTEALGRIAAEDLCAKADQPPFPRSPLDGYAVAAEDIKEASANSPVTLEVIGELLAGEQSLQSVKKGQAVRIMTGAPIPEGADTVIRQEDTDYGEEKVRIYKSAEPFQNYCFQGEDFKKGMKLISSGEKMDAVRIGIVSQMGYNTIRVRQQVKVALITTGSELQMPGAPLKPGHIYNSNLFLMRGRLNELGIFPIYIRHVEDDIVKMADTIRSIAGQADIIITTGGVSVGKKDILPEVLHLLGAKELFRKVQIKPGSPAIGSVYRQTCIISLSGNPFGALAGLEVLVRPLLYEMSGDSALALRRKPAVMEDIFSKESKGRRFVRAILEDGRVYLPSGLHSSGVLSSMKGCNCLIDIPPGNQGLKTGDKVCVIVL